MRFVPLKKAIAPFFLFCLKIGSYSSSLHVSLLEQVCIFVPISHGTRMNFALSKFMSLIRNKCALFSPLSENKNGPCSPPSSSLWLNKNRVCCLTEQEQTVVPSLTEKKQQQTLLLSRTRTDFSPLFHLTRAYCVSLSFYWTRRPLSPLSMNKNRLCCPLSPNENRLFSGSHLKKRKKKKWTLRSSLWLNKNRSSFCCHTDQEQTLLLSPTEQGQSLILSPTEQEQTLLLSPTEQEQTLLLSPTEQEQTLLLSPTKQEQTLLLSPTEQEQTLLLSPTEQEQSLLLSPTEQEQSLLLSPTEQEQSLLPSYTE